MKAIVTEAFPGCRDGECITETFSVGAVVEGNLAAVAVANNWAEQVDDDYEPEADDPFEYLKDLTVAELRAKAEELEIDLEPREKKPALIKKITDHLSEAE